MSENKTMVKLNLQPITLKEGVKDLPKYIKEAEEKSKEKNSELALKADELINNILNIDAKELRSRQEQANRVTNLGSQISEQLASKSAMLKEPMKVLMNDAEDGGDVANALLSLQETVSKINPNRIDFNMGFFRKLLSNIPGIGTPLSRWFAQYQSVEGVLDNIIVSLKDGKARLERDNITLSDDQNDMRELTFELSDYIAFGHILREKMESKINDKSLDDERKKFLEEEIMFSLSQRVLDLQQQLSVNQQGVLTIETIERNNKELIRGVDRTLNVTITALQTASVLAIALQHQKKVLQGIEAVTDTTNDLIVSTSEKLKTQGAEIQKQASSSALDISKLRASFVNIEAALDDISTFRREALPQMAESIIEMDKLTTDMNKSIVKMEQGEQTKNAMAIEL